MHSEYCISTGKLVRSVGAQLCLNASTDRIREINQQRRNSPQIRNGEEEGDVRQGRTLLPRSKCTELTQCSRACNNVQ